LAEIAREIELLAGIQRAREQARRVKVFPPMRRANWWKHGLQGNPHSAGTGRLREIVSFIARNNSIRARTFGNELIDKALSLASLPE